MFMSSVKDVEYVQSVSSPQAATLNFMSVISMDVSVGMMMIMLVSLTLETICGCEPLLRVKSFSEPPLTGTILMALRGQREFNYVN